MKSTKKKRYPSGESVITNRRRLLNAETPFAIKEAYIKLRTSLLFCMTADKSRPCKVFMVTSAKPSEGKSITAANIAISFAMLGKRTILIDADMRKPTQRKLWHIEQNYGLCDYLAKIQPLQIVDIEGIPLSVVCTGTIAPNPSELLSSDSMKKFVAYCAEQYDYVIIDTPPINTVADAQIVAMIADGVVLVARAGNTTAIEINTAIDAVNRAEGNLCGVVLNDMDLKSMKYSYRYRYSDKYGYKYGYKYNYKYSSYYSYASYSNNNESK